MGRGNDLENKLADAKRYELAAVGRKYTDVASAALDAQVQGMGIDEASRELMNRHVFSKKEGREDAIKVYAGKWDKALGNLTVGELSGGYYGNTLDQLVEGEDAAIVKGELAKFKDEKLSDIEKKLERAQYILAGEQHEYTHPESEKQAAKNTIEKYSGAVTILDVLKEAYLETKKPALAVKQRKEKMKKLAEELKTPRTVS